MHVNIFGTAADRSCNLKNIILSDGAVKPLMIG